MVNRFSESISNVQVNKTSQIAGSLDGAESVSPVSNSVIPQTFSPDEAEQEFIPADKVKKMTDSMNKFLESANKELRFKFHEELQTYYVTLVDSKTDEVLREIPSKKLMDIYAAMLDFVGIFVDKKI
ncbi:flagellar protein FlaG [Viridibacillus sp. NPDC093762]|uniref:flagellar protein FlaG n=1 Tax=Viridibacillus sp. NPDC093762 TaxID=3390720 RepID=UPI003CFF1798